MGTVAIAIVCKTPMPGQSKTRLSPPLLPEECAAISACFIQDVTATIATVTADGNATAYALYTPVGSERALRALLPDGFELMPQYEGSLSERLVQGTKDLLRADHEGAILVNSDSPTLPATILRDAVDAVRRGNSVVLSPAYDGGYTLIGLSALHPELFDAIPWSTRDVYRLTVERAGAIGLPVANVPGWYDVDDAGSLEMLENELSHRGLPFAAIPGAHAPSTRRFLRERQRIPPDLNR